MSRYVSHRARAERQIQGRIGIGMLRAGYMTKRGVQVLTPVDTAYAQRSVHVQLLGGGGRQIGGDFRDGNGNPAPDFAVGVDPGDLAILVGSNTYPRPDGLPGGYFWGLEMGFFSRKGSGMLAWGITNLESIILREIGIEVSKG